MRRFVILVGVVGALSFAGIGVAGAAPPPNSGACPTSSPAGGGDPSCGKPRPSEPAPAPDTCRSWVTSPRRSTTR